MEKRPLVSVITPCHNSAAFVYRLMDSLLLQSYPNVEVYVIDNDSKDNTAEVIRSYKERFLGKGYALYYIHQGDLGPSAAMQTGFKYIKGDYLLMPDSDDYYSEPESIDKFVKKFEELPDNYAIVRSQLQFVDERDMSPMNIIGNANMPEDDPGTYFEDCLFGTNNYNYAPIGYMVKVSALRAETKMNIFNAYNVGQQRQICLPLYYAYKAWTIPEPLVCYLVRQKSISHGDYAKYSTQVTLYELNDTYISSILKSIGKMPDKEKVHYKKEYLKECAKDMYLLAVQNKNTEGKRRFSREYLQYGGKPFDLVNKRLKLLLKRITRYLIKIIHR